MNWVLVRGITAASSSATAKTKISSHCVQNYCDEVDNTCEIRQQTDEGAIFGFALACGDSPSLSRPPII